MDLDLRKLIRYARRWWWLMALATLLAGTSAFAVVSRQDPLYSATATLLINGGAQDPSASDYNAVLASQRLAETYRRLVTSQEVLVNTITLLDLPETPADLRENISVKTESDSQLIEIAVSDANPERAALIANTIATRFSTYVADQRIDQSNVSREALDEQIATVQGQLDTTQAELQRLRTAPDAASAANQAQIASLQSTYNTLQQTLSELLLRDLDLQLLEATARSSVIVADEAQAPDTPYAPNVMLFTILSTFAGLMLGAGAAALLEYLDNTVKPGLDFSSVFGAPLMTTIARLPELSAGREQIYIESSPRSSSAEAIRLLRANLEFAATTREIGALAITSANPGEGKSTVAANLALAVAQAGFSTVLIDADLRRPTQHRIWNVRNDRGLSSLLLRWDDPWQEVAANDLLPNLSLITSGPVPPNPADLLSLDRFQTLLEDLRASVDVVIVDTPPLLAVSDSSVIAKDVDGVLVVAYAGQTRIDTLTQALDMLRRRSVRVIGVALNQGTGRDVSGYEYYGSYDESDEPAGDTAIGADEEIRANPGQISLTPSRATGQP